jgi:hypothetical protein
MLCRRSLPFKVCLRNICFNNYTSSFCPNIRVKRGNSTSLISSSCVKEVRQEYYYFPLSVRLCSILTTTRTDPLAIRRLVFLSNNAWPTMLRNMQAMEMPPLHRGTQCWVLKRLETGSPWIVLGLSSSGWTINREPSFCKKLVSLKLFRVQLPPKVFSHHRNNKLRLPPTVYISAGEDGSAVFVLGEF